MNPPFPYIRLVAIDPSTEGFGFAVFEGPRRLVDWGIVHVRGRDKNIESLTRFEYLVEQFEPQAVALEDCSAKGCQRRYRTRVLITQMAEYAALAHFDLAELGVLAAERPSADRLQRGASAAGNPLHRVQRPGG